MADLFTEEGFEQAGLGDFAKEAKIRHEHAIVALQEKAGLTYKEARAYTASSWETDKALAQEWGVTIEAIYNLTRRAEVKIAKTGLTMKEICDGQMPFKIFVNPA